MKFFLITVLSSLLTLSSFANETYYTSGAGNGEWNDPASWTLTENGTDPAGVPTIEDDVVIRHYLTHKTITDYTHEGNVTIQAGGTYELLTGIESNGTYFFSGNVFAVAGVLITSSNFHHQPESNDNGKLVFEPSALVFIGGHLILDGKGETELNNGSCGAGQTFGTLFFRSTNSFICGSGSFIIASDIRAWDDAGQEITSYSAALEQVANQMCTEVKLFSSPEACTADQPVVQGMGTLTSPIEDVAFTQKQMKFFPNPATSFENVTLEMEGFDPFESVTLSIMNMMGQVMEQQQVTANGTGTLEHRWNPTLQQGNYVMAVSSEKGKIAKPFFIR